MLPLFLSFNLLVEEYINDGVGKEENSAEMGVWIGAIEISWQSVCEILPLW